MNDTVKTPEANAGASHRPRQMTRGRRILFAIAAPILTAFLKLAWATFRFRVHEDKGFAELVERGESMVFAFWHEGLMTVGWYAASLLKRGVRVTFLISPSTDGELGVQILARFGCQAVRGSARRLGTPRPQTGHCSRSPVSGHHGRRVKGPQAVLQTGCDRGGADGRGVHRSDRVRGASILACSILGSSRGSDAWNESGHLGG
jgi:hypothetical protein